MVKINRTKRVGKMIQTNLFEFKELGLVNIKSNGQPLYVHSSHTYSGNVRDVLSVSERKLLKPNKQRQVLDMLIQNGSTTAFDIQKATNSTDARKIISRLRKEGYVGKTTQVVGSNGIKHAKYYWSGKKV